MPKVFLVSLLAILLLSCNDKKKINNDKEKKASSKGDVFIVTDNIPENWKLPRKNGGYSHSGTYEIEYTVDGVIPTFFFPDYKKQRDTLLIKNIDAQIEIEHKYKGHDFFSFIVNPKDSIQFTYDGKMPILNFLNRKSEKVNYEYMIRKTVYNDDVSSYVKYTFPSIFFIEDINPSNFKEIDSLFKEEHYIKAQKELIGEKILLDSLIAVKGISEESARFYSLRIKYRKIILNIRKSGDADFMDFTQVDSLIKYSFYKEYINAISENSFLKKVGVKKSSGYSIPDPEAMFDTINKSAYLSIGTKRYLLFKWLDKIINSSSNEKSGYYFKEFKSKYGKKNKDLVEYFVDKYKLEENVSSDLVLVDESGKKSSFNQILEKNKGKILYVDFWASWCAPCRDAMPASNKLREKFKNKKITFIYLSLNDKLEHWQRAITKVELAGNQNSFFISNSKTSSMVDDLKIESIPRYIIFGSNNEILYKNALAPNDKDIESFLNLLLIEN